MFFLLDVLDGCARLHPSSTDKGHVMEQYEVVSGATASALAEAVNRMFKRGYLPLGGVAVVYDGVTFNYHQAVAMPGVTAVRTSDGGVRVGRQP